MFNSVFTLDRRKATKQRKRNLSSNRKKNDENNKNKERDEREIQKRIYDLISSRILQSSSHSRSYSLSLFVYSKQLKKILRKNDEIKEKSLKEKKQFFIIRSNNIEKEEDVKKFRQKE